MRSTSWYFFLLFLLFFFYLFVLVTFLVSILSLCVNKERAHLKMSKLIFQRIKKNVEIFILPNHQAVRRTISPVCVFFFCCLLNWFDLRDKLIQIARFLVSSRWIVIISALRGWDSKLKWLVCIVHTIRYMKWTSQAELVGAHCLSILWT